MYEYTGSSTLTTIYTFNDADELSQYTIGGGTMTFTYASDGSLKTKSDGTDTWTHEWDYEGHLIAFKKNAATLVEYAYSPTGTRRYSSDSTLGLTNYFYSGGHVLADYSSNWSLNKSYIMGPRVDEIIAVIGRTTDPNVTHYFTRDRLGSTRELVNTSETVKTRYAYNVWGDPTETQLSGSVTTRYQFTGRSFDSTSDLYYYRARHYDNDVGRFTSRDPLYNGSRRHVDSYVYVGNNPATMVDPMGLMGGPGDNELSVCFSMSGSFASMSGFMSSLPGTASQGMFASAGGAIGGSGCFKPVDDDSDGPLVNRPPGMEAAMDAMIRSMFGDNPWDIFGDGIIEPEGDCGSCMPTTYNAERGCTIWYIGCEDGKCKYNTDCP